MKFWEAMKEMSAGKKLTLPHWDKDKYLSFNTLKSEYILHGTRVGTIKMNSYDFTREDWELYVDNNEVKKLRSELSDLKNRFNALLETNRQLNNSVVLEMKDNSLHPEMIKLHRDHDNGVSKR